MKIITECFAETHFLKFLGFHPLHQRVGGMSKLYKDGIRMTETIVGIVDNDIIKPASDKDFNLITSSNDMSFWKHKKRDFYLVKQNPDFENWVFGIFTKRGLLKRDSKFKTVKDLKGITKKDLKIRRDQEYNRLLQKAHSTDNSPFQVLIEFLGNIEK